jgi:hypothetical protein
MENGPGILSGLSMTLRFFLGLLAALCALKALQYWLDNEGLAQYDSAGFVINAMKIAFMPFRSYTYSVFLRHCVLPFHSLSALVAAQTALGAFTAAALGFGLARYGGVRPWLSAAAAVAFALDPVQVIAERLLMAETFSLALDAAFILLAWEYPRRPRWILLIGAAILAAGLAVSRTVYVPTSLVLLAALPAAAWLTAKRISRRNFALGLLCGCGLHAALFALHQWRTSSWFFSQASMRHYDGFFLLAPVSPLVQPGDSADPRVQAVLRARGPGISPLTVEKRLDQLWFQGGLVDRLQTAFGGDQFAANHAAKSLALAAIRRDPLGYAGLAARTALQHVNALPDVWSIARTECGATPGQLPPAAIVHLRGAFGVDLRDQYRRETLARRYLYWGCPWYGVLLAAPLLAGAALWASRGSHFCTLLFLRDCVLFTAICFGAVEPVMRYLHPFSFSVLAGLAILAETALRQRPHLSLRPPLGRETDR